MGMQNTPYASPKGFYSNFSVDKTGQLFSDGKALNGIMMDPKSAASGGKILGLSTDKNGNVYADISRKKTPQPAGGMANLNWISGEASTPMAGDKVSSSANPFEQYNTYQTTRVKLSGVQLDPERFSKSGNGELGANQLYLRPDSSGAYFAQVNQGSQIAAYAYSAFQQTKSPVGGAETPAANTQRRQGGNAGGGVSNTSTMVSLLGD